MSDSDNDTNGSEGSDIEALIEETSEDKSEISIQENSINPDDSISFIGPQKKKPINILDSESSDDEVFYTNNSDQIEVQYNSLSSSETPDLLEPVDHTKNGISASASVLSETQDAPSKSSLQKTENSLKSLSRELTKRSTAIESSDTDIIDCTPNNSNEIDVLPDSTSANPANLSNKIEQVANKGDDDELNLSAKMKKSRMTEQFTFGRDILNSTEIHNQGPADPVKNWRLSNANMETPDIDSSVEIFDTSSEIIEVSSGELIIESPPESPVINQGEKKIIIQPTLKHFINEVPSTSFKSPPKKVLKDKIEQKIELVTREEYQMQNAKVERAEMEFVRIQSTIENIDMKLLPDKGKIMEQKMKEAENKFMKEQAKLNRMQVSKDAEATNPPQTDFLRWEDIQAGANAVVPKTFGKQAVSTLNAQKAVTLDRLQQLHEALLTCPKEDDQENDPKGLKVPLMPHQRRALAWMMFREKEKPSGGILADDMGLGKTLTMISLILKTLIIERENEDDQENRDEFVGKHTKFSGGSLIICPASLLQQWSCEIEKMVKRGRLSYNLYHGANREKRAKSLAEYNVVITTYHTIKNESDARGAPFRVNWRRIILDEAHQIRNHKSQISEACCLVPGKSRWALTGTPIQNKELDMYALLKFLRCSPFDDLQVWKRWVGDKSLGGSERLHTVISSLMLRRTKAELMQKGALTALPEKKWLLVKVKLDQREQEVYHKVLIFSQTLFAQFLHQRAVKNQDYADYHGQGNNVHNEEYNKMRQKILKLNKVKNVSQHEILVLLLRLRQICCHPSLIKEMLNDDLPDLDDDPDEDKEQLNILEQLNKLNLEDDEDVYKPPEAVEDAGGLNGDRVKLKEATKGIFHPSDPVFAKERPSSKIIQMIEILKNEVPKEDKAIIVSQWASYLRLVSEHLKQLDIEFAQLDGSVPVNKRMDMVNRFNDKNSPMKVMLLSLTAGGVGLNLVGANHLFLLDLHWNPQLENQAQDRIYRMGQQKPVFVYKFMCEDSIEERIKLLQEKKLALSEGILTGTKQVVENKLSMDDLKLLFSM